MEWMVTAMAAKMYLQLDGLCKNKLHLSASKVCIATELVG